MKKCILSTILSLALVFNTMGMTAFAQGGLTDGKASTNTLPMGLSGTTPPTSFTGSGTPDDPYLINDGPDLALLATKVNGGESYANKVFQLNGPIDLNPGQNVSGIQAGYAEFTAIGTTSHPFSGIFDGKGNTITGLYVDRKTGESTLPIGLFGLLKDATVKNLIVTGGYLQSLVSSDMGAIAGTANNSTIENCQNDGVKLCLDGASSSSVGGIVGQSQNNSKTTNCLTTAAAEVKTGGKGAPNVGGVVGLNDASTLVNCVNLSAVASTNNDIGLGSHPDVGGVVGWNTTTSAIRNCANSGIVVNSGTWPKSNMERTIGGVVGKNDGTVTNCFNSAWLSLTDDNQCYAGTVVGYTSTTGRVEFCYGKVNPYDRRLMVGNLDYPKGNGTFDKPVGIVTGCGTLDNNVSMIDLKITVMCDYSDKELTHWTYDHAKEDASTTLANAMNSWMQKSGVSKVEKFWILEGGNLLPKSDTLPSTTYTITFDANGGSVSPASGTTTDGKLASLPTPTQSGYTFDGWFTAASGGTQVTIDTTYDADTTIYAHF
ncbi:MAG: InlB B-repeat-containing protein, partial [Angelakisella sp.]